MIQEEDVSMTNQFNKIAQISHVGTKLSKLQLQQMNLEKIIQYCMQLIENGISFRESTNYLHGLAVVYLKQYQLLRSEIALLQHSMMNKENFVEVEKKNPRSKTKQTKPKQNQKEAIAELQEHSNSSRDHPRNIASAERLQLDSQRTPFDINMFLRRGDSDSSNSYGAAANILRDVQSIEKQSLKEIMQNRKNLKDNSQASSNPTSKNTPMLPRIVVNEIDGNQLVYEEQPQFENDVEPEFEEEIVDNSVQVKHLNIMTALEEFGIHIESQASQSKQQEKRVSKKQAFSKQLDLTDRDRGVNDVYEKNLEEFIKFQDQIEDLQLRMNVMNLQPEFWSKQDELIDMINRYEIPLNQTVLNMHNQNQQSNSKLTGLTTFEQSKNQFQESTNFHEEEQEDISEFQQVNFQFGESSHKKNADEFKIYERLIQDLKTQFSKERVISSIQYFNYRQGAKAKAFYDLLIMSRLGMCKVQQKQHQEQFTQMQIEF